MFSKRKKAKELRREKIHEGWIEQEKDFDDAIREAEQVKDPSEKILALREIERGIGAQIDGENAKISDASYRALIETFNVGTGVSMGTAATGVIVSLFTASPLGLIAAPVGVAGMLGSAVLSGRRSRGTRGRLRESAQVHIERLMGQMARISRITEETVHNNVQEISVSPLYNEVRQVPGVADVFADAAAKQIAADKKAAEGNRAAPLITRKMSKQIGKAGKF